MVISGTNRTVANIFQVDTNREMEITIHCGSVRHYGRIVFKILMIKKI